MVGNTTKKEIENITKLISEESMKNKNLLNKAKNHLIEASNYIDLHEHEQNWEEKSQEEIDKAVHNMNHAKMRIKNLLAKASNDDWENGHNEAIKKVLSILGD